MIKNYTKYYMLHDSSIRHVLDLYEARFKRSSKSAKKLSTVANRGHPPPLAANPSDSLKENSCE